jgi:non-ribosomal peptide synthetase component E (peptide arylation enzyme)
MRKEVSNYKPSDHGSINMKTPFTIGGYYKTI